MTDQLDPVRLAISATQDDANQTATNNQDIRAALAEGIDAAQRNLADAIARVNAMFENARALSLAPLDLSSISDALGKVAFPPETMFRTIVAPTDGTPANDAIQNAIDSADGPLYLPAGVYAINGLKPIKLRDGLQLFMHADAVLRVNPNNAIRYYVFLGENISDVLIQGGQLLGDRMSHIYVDTGNSTRTHEWGMGVGIKGGKRITLRNMYIAFFTGDGLSISGQDLHIVNCVSLRNRRQGMSIYAAKRVRVVGGEYAWTGNYSVGGISSAGTKPMAGIDIEPDGGDTEDVVFENVNIHDNGTTDLLAWSRDEDPNRTDEINIRGVVARNCRIIGAPNGVQGKGLGGVVEIEVYGCTLANHKGAAIMAEAGATITVGGNTLADRNFFDTIDAKLGDLPGIVTRYDMQSRTTGVIKAGLNNYK